MSFKPVRVVAPSVKEGVYNKKRVSLSTELVPEIFIRLSPPS